MQISDQVPWPYGGVDSAMNIIKERIPLPWASTPRYAKPPNQLI